jgi:hypothetical protein
MSSGVSTGNICSRRFAVSDPAGIRVLQVPAHAGLRKDGTLHQAEQAGL